MKISKMSIWSELENNSSNVLKFFFEKSNIVSALYKFLKDSEQVAVLKTMSCPTKKLYANNEEKIMSGVMKQLKLIYNEPEKIQLNEVFRVTMNGVLRNGRDVIFKKIRTNLENE